MGFKTDILQVEEIISDSTIVLETLTTEGTTVTLNNITTPTDVNASGGGLTLKGGATDKTILWDDTNDNWTSNQHFNIASSLDFKINNVSVLNATTLGSSVVSSSLTSLGTITSLVATMADINGGTIDGATIGGSTAGAITGTTITSIIAGTAKATTNFLTLTNSGNAVDMDATGTAIAFNQYYYDGATPAIADSGKIAIITETDWTSDVNTQDSYMSFQTSLNGTVAEKMKLTSGGELLVKTSTNYNYGSSYVGVLSNSAYAFIGTTSMVDTTDKYARNMCMHYTITEEPFTLIHSSSTVVGNGLNFGGGTSIGNAASNIQFYVGIGTATGLSNITGVVIKSYNGVNGNKNLVWDAMAKTLTFDGGTATTISSTTNGRTFISATDTSILYISYDVSDMPVGNQTDTLTCVGGGNTTTGTYVAKIHNNGDFLLGKSNANPILDENFSFVNSETTYSYTSTDTSSIVPWGGVKLLIGNSGSLNDSHSTLLFRTTNGGGTAQYAYNSFVAGTTAYTTQYLAWGFRTGASSYAEKMRLTSSGNLQLTGNATLGAINYAVDAGSTDDYVITLNPAISSYTTGQIILFKANTQGDTGATLNVNGLGAINIVKGVSTALAAGDIIDEMLCLVVYNGTAFVLLNPKTLP